MISYIVFKIHIYWVFWVDFELILDWFIFDPILLPNDIRQRFFSRKIVLASVRPNKDLLLSDNLYYFCMKTCVIHWSKNQSIKILEHFSTKLFAAKLREKTWKKIQIDWKEVFKILLIYSNIKNCKKVSQNSCKL